MKRCNGLWTDTVLSCSKYYMMNLQLDYDPFIQALENAQTMKNIVK